MSNEVFKILIYIVGSGNIIMSLVRFDGGQYMFGSMHFVFWFFGMLMLIGRAD